MSGKWQRIHASMPWVLQTFPFNGENPNSLRFAIPSKALRGCEVSRLRVDIRNCPSFSGGKDTFTKNMKTEYRKMINAGKIMSDTSKYCQHEVVGIKMTSKWCRIQHQSRPRKPPVAIIHIFARFFEVQLGGHGADKRGKERTTER